MNSKRWTVLGLALGILGLVSGFLVCRWLLGGEETARVPRYDQTAAMVRPGEDMSPPPVAVSPVEAAQHPSPDGSPPPPGAASPAAGTPEPGGTGLPAGTPGTETGAGAGSPVPDAASDRATSTLAPTEEHPASPGAHHGRTPAARRVAQAPPGPEPPINAPGSGETPEQPTPTPEKTPDEDKKPDDKGTKAGKGSKDGKPGKAGKAGKAAPTKVPKKGGESGSKEDASAPPILRDHARNLDKWKPGIVRYCKRHYGDDSWKLEPTCIVLHYTAGTTFPSNLVDSTTFDGEPPGLASHYVVDGAKIWEILPPTVRSRGAYGINHRAINIEMVASSAGDLARRPATLKACVALVRYLMERFDIPKSKVYSHTDVSHMDPKRVPEVKDLVDPSAYGKPDPGEQNMKSIKARL